MRQYASGYVIRLKFRDGTAGEIDNRLNSFETLLDLDYAEDFLAKGRCAGTREQGEKKSFFHHYLQQGFATRRAHGWMGGGHRRSREQIVAAIECSYILSRRWKRK